MASAQSVPILLDTSFKTYYRGQFCIDGGFTCNSPKLYHNTITVCPYPSTSDICPQNILPFNPTIAHDLESCRIMSRLGYEAAMSFGIEKFLECGWKLKTKTTVAQNKLN